MDDFDNWIAEHKASSWSQPLDKLRNSPEGKDETWWQTFEVEGVVFYLWKKYPDEKPFLTKIGERLITLMSDPAKLGKAIQNWEQMVAVIAEGPEVSVQ